MSQNAANGTNGQRSTLMFGVAEAEKTVFVKLAGRTTCEVGKTLKDVLNQLHQLGFRRFMVELTDCLIIDSTILGVLAGFGVKIARAPGAQDGDRVRLLNPNSRVAGLFENLGVMPFFRVVTSPPAGPAQYRPLPEGTPAASKQELTQTSLEAHQFLMEINPHNIPKFKDVARFLEEDLARLKAQQHPN